jgi:hypothetical protein
LDKSEDDSAIQEFNPDANFSAPQSGIGGLDSKMDARRGKGMKMASYILWLRRAVSREIQAAHASSLGKSCCTFHAGQVAFKDYSEMIQECIWMNMMNKSCIRYLISGRT